MVAGGGALLVEPPVSLERVASAVGGEAVDLDDQALLRPVSVGFVATDLRLGQRWR